MHLWLIGTGWKREEAGNTAVPYFLFNKKNAMATK